MLPASREVFFRGVGRFVFGVAFRIIRHWGLSIWSVGQRMTDKGMQRVCFVADHQQVRVSGLHARSRYSPAARPARKWPGEDQASGMPNGHPLDNFPTRPKIKRRSPDCFEFIISCPPARAGPRPSPRHPGRSDRLGETRPGRSRRNSASPRDSGQTKPTVARETLPVIVKFHDPVIRKWPRPASPHCRSRSARMAMTPPQLAHR